jgi:hypothetical protein
LITEQSYAQSTTTTPVGCITNNDILVTDSGAYNPVGKDNEIAEHGDDWVRIRGKLLPKTGDGPQTIEVQSIITVSKSQAPKLDPAVRNVSQWQTYSNQTHGVHVAFPRTFDLVKGRNSGLFDLPPPHFTKNDNIVDLHRSEIPRTIYVPQPYSGNKFTRLQLDNPPFSNFYGGAFAVYVNPQITDAVTCKRFDPDLGEGDISSRTINGINYTVSKTSSVGGGSGEDFDTFHTFQNGRCFEVDFQMGITGSTGVDVTCAIEDADVDALETLLLSKISFFQPKPAAAPTHQN